jgi:hypothetical protein
VLQLAWVTAPVSMQGVNRRIGAMQCRCNAADVMTSCCAPSCCKRRGIGIATEMQRLAAVASGMRAHPSAQRPASQLVCILALLPCALAGLRHLQVACKCIGI